MKQVICLPDGSRIEIEESNVKHIGKDDNVLYDSTEMGKVINKSNDSQEYVGLRKSLFELSQQHFDISETINTTEKHTFFRVLKNMLECTFCKEKDCLARYSPDKTGLSLSYSGQYYPIGCRKERRK